MSVPGVCLVSTKRLASASQNSTLLDWKLTLPTVL